MIDPILTTGMDLQWDWFDYVCLVCTFFRCRPFICDPLIEGEFDKIIPSYTTTRFE